MEEKGKTLLSDISDDDIAEIIKIAKKEAAEHVKGLAMVAKDLVFFLLLYVALFMNN